MVPKKAIQEQILRFKRTIHQTNLFSSFFYDEEHVRAVTDSKSKAVFQGIAAIVMVTDAVLINVVHGEGVGLPVVLTIAGALDGAMTGSLNDCERDQVLLQGKVSQEEVKKQYHH